MPLPRHPSFTPIPGRLFAWGSGQPDAAIPGAPALRDQQKHVPFPVPVPVPGGLKFVQILADTGGCFAALESSGNAVVWGSSQHGFPEQADFSLKTCSKQLFTLLAVGDNFNFVVGIEKDSCALLAWNLSSDAGRDAKTDGFHPVPELAGRKVVDVAAAGHVCLAVVESESEEAAASNLTEPGASDSRPNIVLGPKRTPTPTLFMRYKGASSAPYAPFSKAFAPVPELRDRSIVLISVGSQVRACVDDSNSLFAWGTNKSGCLGLGKRHSGKTVDASEVLVPQQVPLPPDLPAIISLDCCRGQPNPKNDFPDPTGQEGPRIHFATADGGLWIAGTCHKGLGADHFGKVLVPEKDHLCFYRVGGAARNAAGVGDFGKLSLTGGLDGLSVSEAREMLVTVTSSKAEKMKKEHLLDGAEAGLGSPALSDSGAKFALAECGINPDAPSYFEESGQNLCTRFLSAAPIVASVASSIHSLCLSADGRVFGWGCGSDGRLGVPHFFKKDGSKRLMKCYVSSPSRVGAVRGENSAKSQTDFRDEKVIAISVGRYWSFAIVE
eukprot:g15482.t1